MGLKRFINPKKITKGVTKGIADLHTRTAELTTSEEFREDFKEKIRDKDKSLLITAPYETWKKKPKVQTNDGPVYLADFNIGMSQAVPLAEGGRVQLAEGTTAIDEQMADIMPEEEEALPIETVEEPTETMLPDEEMEGDYIDFVIDEALTTEEEQYLLDRLGGDDQLSMIFDKVVETASEFSGAGSVEGPGNAVSDSIPARLSDGEFVMTSKAANQIGPDNLHGLMEVAEAEADDEEFRRTAQTGGQVSTEEIEEEALQPIAVKKPIEEAGILLPESEVAKRQKRIADSLNPRNTLFAS